MENYYGTARSNFFGYLIVQLLTISIVVWPILSLVALFALRRSHLTSTNQVLWAFMIVAVPVFGGLAFFIIKPNGSNQS